MLNELYDVCSPDGLPSSFKTTGLSFTVSTPGKVILHGEHSVVYEKLALAASLDLRTKLTMSEIDAPDSFVIRCCNLGFTKAFSLQSIKKHLLEPHLTLNRPDIEFNWKHPDLVHHQSLLDKLDDFLVNEMVCFNSNQLTSLKSIFYLLAGIFASVDIELSSVFVDVSTELDIGAGTGSSASFLVSVSAAFIQYVKRKCKCGNLSKEGYRPSPVNIEMSKFSKRELEVISNWAYCAEKIVHGTPSGLDNSVCTYGSVVEFRKGLSPKPLEISCPLELLLINTKVPRETKLLVSKVAELHVKYPDLVISILDAMDEVAGIALQNITALSEIVGKVDNVQKPAVDDVQKPAVDDVQNPAEDVDKCYEELGQLFTMNHNLLSALGVSHIKLDEAVYLLAKHGLHGKLTGAGGGGYAIALVPPSFDSVALDKAVKDLVYNGFGVTCTELGGEGVRIEKSRWW